LIQSLSFYFYLSTSYAFSSSCVFNAYQKCQKSIYLLSFTLLLVLLHFCKNAKNFYRNQKAKYLNMPRQNEKPCVVCESVDFPPSLGQMKLAFVLPFAVDSSKTFPRMI